MKTAIIYGSRKGFVREAALKLAEGVPENTQVYDLAKTRKIDLGPYQALVFAGSLAAGRFHAKVKRFIMRNLRSFEGKKVFLLSSGLDHEGYRGALEKNFTAPVLQKMEDVIYIGGRYLPEQHGAIVRKMMAKINKGEGAVHKEQLENLDPLIEKLR